MVGRSTRPLMATVPFSPRRSRTPDYVHQVLAVLCGTDPLVWRRVQVPLGYSFWDLHVALQDAMGWEDLGVTRGEDLRRFSFCTL